MPTVQICTCRGVIKKCDECCYNFRQVVQNVRSVVTICDGCTKCDKRYYILCMTKYQNLTSVVIISDRYYKKLKTVITFCDRCVITKSYNCYYNLLQVFPNAKTCYYVLRLVPILQKESDCNYDLRKGLEHSSVTT